MYSLNAINLIQAGTITTAMLGAVLLWRVAQFRGIAILFVVTAFASMINILEESGITRDIYLISPVFILLVGPVTFLAVLKLTKHPITPKHYLHLLPAVLALGFTSYVQVIIGIGTVIRIVYAVLSAAVLYRYKQSMDEKRSDSDEFSFNWLIWLVLVMAVVNFTDLVRLNVQQLIPHQLNLFGQGFNNVMWLVATMVIIVKLMEQGKSPQEHDIPSSEPTSSADEYEYQAIFAQLDNDIKDNQWYRQARLTLNDLSALSGLQSRDISRAINLIAKRSFNDYINGFRVNYVRDVIQKSPALSFTHIAADAGFSSKASFNQSFKKLARQTPSEYKKQLET